MNAIPLPPNAIAYLRGPIAFMRDMRAGLLHRGVHSDDIKYEMSVRACCRSEAVPRHDDRAARYTTCINVRRNSWSSQGR